ncbi:MAG: Uncharacterized protein G01um10145_544 [Microgenomates group bacterium Gr01-1014_5]|nr:MAG: Uncharacterized protein G01um10145_544 [Microgenomates group bacterium Gr01-1014_5]
MLIPPKYIHTPKISELLSQIEAAKQVIDSINIPPEVETNIRRQSTLKSSLFSARIEGNPLTIEELGKTSTDQKRQEVFNILKALNKVQKQGLRDITQSIVLDMHKITMLKLTDTPGKFRTEVSAIFNSAGIAVYIPPPPRQIPGLLKKLIKFANSPKEQFVPIRAVLAHYSFEKIHPFLDGNGRVGRLLIQLSLQKSGYGMKGLLAIEEYLDKYRSTYYTMLSEGQKDVTDYVEFMLEAIAESANKAKDQVLKKKDLTPEDYLLPRRAEILNIVKEQKLVNFDQIKRRFSKVNDRTLRYDLKKLADQRLIRKLGTTRGVYYQAG